MKVLDPFNTFLENIYSIILVGYSVSYKYLKLLSIKRWVQSEHLFCENIQFCDVFAF
jgi:hypothetical protein